MQFFKRLVVVFVACGSLLFAKASLAVTYVCVESTFGVFCMEMLEEDAPVTVANFLNYVRDGDFNKTFIHRSIRTTTIHGGSYKFDPFLEGVPQDPQIPNEFKLSNVRGTVAMAKLANQPDSAASEWLINLTDNSATLDTTNGGYTVFAKIVFGMTVVDEIGSAEIANLSPTLGDDFGSVPVTTLDPNGVGVEDLMQITRVYITDTLPLDPDPYVCTADWVASIQPTQVCMDTALGSFCIDLLPGDAPLTVANFLHYVADGDYNGTFFHRSVKDFVVQAGGLKVNPLFSPVPTDPIVDNEFSVSNTRGTVAMAKVGGAVNSATSQWFVNTVDNSSQLDTRDGGFTVFGRIDDGGMAVIDQIAALRIYNLDDENENFPLLRELPLMRETIVGDLNLGDFVKISNAYIPGVGPNPCFPVKPAALTEYVDGKFEVPVRIGESIFLILFERELNNDGYVYRVNFNKIRSMVDRVQEAALFTPDDGLLVIPSIVINGSTVLTNVRLRLTDPSILQFTVESEVP